MPCGMSQSPQIGADVITKRPFVGPAGRLLESQSPQIGADVITARAATRDRARRSMSQSPQIGADVITLQFERDNPASITKVAIPSNRG